MTARLAAFLAAALTLACGAAAAQPLGIGTSPQGTLNYTLGATYAKALDDALHLQARVQPSSGTAVVLPLVNSGELDVGFVNTLELAEAYAGAGTFKRAHKELRTVGILFPIRVGFFVRKDSPIKSVKDLKGKAIPYGYTSQEIIKLTVDAMLATEGLTVADLKPVLVPNLIRGVDEFMSGRVDVTTFAIGSAKVSEADASVGGIRYVPISDTPEALAAMRKVFRTAYIDKVEPAPNFAGVKEPIKTMFYAYTVFTNADLPAARVKEITRLIAENKDSLAQSQPLFRGMDVQRLWTDIGVPFHDGAIAYYREKGIKEIR